MALLEVSDLGVEFGTDAAPFRAVDNVSLHVDAGEVLGIVGESGSGKSVTALALMGLIDEPGRVHAQRMSFDGRDLLKMPLKERRSLLGKDIAMIFQDPMASLNPCFTVEYQLVETLRLHDDKLPITLWVVHVREASPPADTNPVEWFLLTTCKQGDVEDALACVRWYCLRWRIEDWHSLVSCQPTNSSRFSIWSNRSLRRSSRTLIAAMF